MFNEVPQPYYIISIKFGQHRYGQRKEKNKMKVKKKYVKTKRMKETEGESLKHAWKIQSKFISKHQLLCAFELRKFWTEWVQKVAKTDNVSLLIEKFKTSLLEGGILRNPLMNFSVGKKKSEPNLWFSKLVLLVKEKSSETNFMKCWKKNSAENWGSKLLYFRPLFSIFFSILFFGYSRNHVSGF